MTQTLIEQLEKLKLYWPGNRGEMYPAMTKEGSRPRYVGANDLRAIIEQHKQNECQVSSEIMRDALLRSVKVIAPTPQPDIITELLKALEDDAYAASFQSMAGYRTALIAKVKGVVG